MAIFHLFNALYWENSGASGETPIALPTVQEINDYTATADKQFYLCPTSYEVETVHLAGIRDSGRYRWPHRRVSRGCGVEPDLP